MWVLYNAQIFNQQGFGADSTRKVLELQKVVIDRTTPSYWNTFIEMSELTDETAYLQFG